MPTCSMDAVEVREECFFYRVGPRKMNEQSSKIVGLENDEDEKLMLMLRTSKQSSNPSKIQSSCSHTHKMINDGPSC